MHRVWDSGIIERAGRGEDAWLAGLVAMDTPEARAKAMSGSVEEWATESLLAARGAYQDPATSMRIRPGAWLADAYQDEQDGAVLGKSRWRPPRLQGRGRTAARSQASVARSGGGKRPTSSR